MFAILDELIDGHEACSNDFFEHGKTRGWTFEELAAFAPDYYLWVRSFPRILAGLVNNVRDDRSCFFLTQILFSELGSGVEERTHFRLLGQVLEKLGLQAAEIATGPRYAETRQLVEGLESLYKDRDVLRAMGAQYALEKQAFPMLAQLYAGFRHFQQLEGPDFEYFEIHLVEEPEHLRCMQQCIGHYLRSPGDQEMVVAGVQRCLDLIAAFWRREYAAVVAVREGSAMGIVHAQRA